MRVHNINKITRIYNVIGTIRGSVEPGELVDYFRRFVFTKITRVREDKFQSTIDFFLADVKQLNLE